MSSIDSTQVLSTAGSVTYHTASTCTSTCTSVFKYETLLQVLVQVLICESHRIPFCRDNLGIRRTADTDNMNERKAEKGEKGKNSFFIEIITFL